MHILAQKNRPKVIDLLTERLTFERTGVQLYDAILRKMEQSNDPQIAKMIATMREHREHEKQHEEWLEAQVRKLGGDTNALTEMAKLVKTESEGIGKVVLDGDPDIGHLFHALLAAELVDNAGWELLIELADEADDDEARRAFKKFLHEEEEHLIFVRRAVRGFARNQVLGLQPSLPTAPL